MPSFGCLGRSDDICHGGSLWPSTLGNRPGVYCLANPWRWRVHGMCYPGPGASRNGIIFFPGWWHPWCWRGCVRRQDEHPWRTKGKRLCGSIRKPSDTIPGDITSINQMVSVQPGIISQVTVSLTHARFWAATIFWTNTQITSMPT